MSKLNKKNQIRGERKATIMGAKYDDFADHYSLASFTIRCSACSIISATISKDFKRAS